MECMGAKALKSSFSSETNMKSVNSQGIIDDIWCVTGDDFLIDDFFDLPNDEITLKNNEEGKLFLEEEEEDEKCCNSSGSNGAVDDSTRFSAVFAVPDDDMQELELWSHLMDDSDPILTYPKPSMDANNKKTGFTFVNRVEPFRNPSVVRASFFPTAVPVKPRSKRSRSIGNRSWYTSSPPKTESSSSSSSPVSTLLFPPPVHEKGMFYLKPPMKKPKKKPVSSSNGETGLRRCTHCQVTKTPQWRAGPNGPKSLCNACGVRFKSGRLFPEYRPACSPTFSSEVHSNSHRKVLEMRRRKEISEPPSTGSGHLALNG